MIHAGRPAVQMALADVAVDVANVDYINAHGTSTPVGDVCEAKALQTVSRARRIARLPVSSTKSMTGHLLSGCRRGGGACLPRAFDAGHPANHQSR